MGIDVVQTASKHNKSGNSTPNVRKQPAATKKNVFCRIFAVQGFFFTISVLKISKH